MEDIPTVVLSNPSDGISIIISTTESVCATDILEAKVTLIVETPITSLSDEATICTVPDIDPDVKSEGSKFEIE